MWACRMRNTVAGFVSKLLRKKSTSSSKEKYCVFEREIPRLRKKSFSPYKCTAKYFEYKLRRLRAWSFSYSKFSCEIKITATATEKPSPNCKRDIVRTTFTVKSIRQRSPLFISDGNRSCTMNHNNHINALNTWYILTWRLVDSIPQHERSCWWGSIFIAHQGPTPFPWTFKWLSIFMESKRKRNRIEFSPYKLNLLERWPIVSLSERVYFTCFCCFCFFYQASCNCWWNSLYNDDNDDNYFEVDIMWLLMIPNWKLTLTDRMSIATTTRTGKNVSSTKTKKASS